MTKPNDATEDFDAFDCSSSATQDQKEALARRSFMEFAKAYKYSIAFDEDAYEFCSASTERAWVAFWNGWESRNEELVMSKEEIEAGLRAAGIDMAPAIAKLHAMIEAKKAEQKT